MWDFTKIPDSEWQNIENLYNKNNYVKLVQIHDRYKVSEYDYCCREKGFMKWIKAGIKWNKSRT
jgi:hypothetical protein